VPDTIEDVLRARIDRLPDEPKRLLQTASILGREFSLRLLGMIWDGSGPSDPHLRELIRLEFLYEKTGAQEPVYVFRHALTQEVVYASLSPSGRGALHGAAGRALEVLYEGRLNEALDRLAYHYSKSEDSQKAVEYLTRFAEKAARGFTHAEAVTALQEAVAHVERLPDEERGRRRLDLILRQAFSLIPLGRFGESLGVLLGQRECVERLRDPWLSSRYYLLLGQTQSFLGEHELATRSAWQAIEEATQCQDEATTGKAYCLLALEGPLSGEALQGIEHGRQAIRLLEQTKERWWLGHAHWLVGLNHIQTGEFQQALEASARAHAIGEAIGDPRLQTFAAWATGTAHAAMGEWDAGVEACRRGLERSPDPLNTAIVKGWLGFAYLEQGDPTHAIPLLEESVRETGRFGFRKFEGWFTIFLAEACRLNLEHEKALDHAREGLRIATGAKFPVGVGWAHHVLGRIALARGALSEAEIHLAEARSTFTAIHSRYELARTHLDLAALAHAQASKEALVAHISRALELFTTLKVPRYIERAEQLAKAFGVR
jgi:tetratricopeptide (TPR) repeat protein